MTNALRAISRWRTRSLRNGAFAPLPRVRLFQHRPSDSHDLRSVRLASATSPNLPQLSLSTDTELKHQARAEIITSNHSRNQFFRQSFRDNDSATGEQVERKLYTPFVPTARDYPWPKATTSSRRAALKAARVQVGFDNIGSHFSSQVPPWPSTFNLLKRMTPKRSEAPRMAAVRIVLPQSWDFDVSNKRVEFVDSTTGLAAKLRVSADQLNPNAIVLRGRSEVLAKAADEIIAACNDVQVFKLGELATVDYHVKRLWPAIDDMPDGDASIPVGKDDTIWVHREPQTQWIDWPYEKTPRPASWTKESFETYITTLVCGRLRSDLAMTFYQQPRKDGKLIDTDGVKVALLMEAFEDPAARPFVTPSVLKLVLSLLVRKGGHRATAERLFSCAETWGVPMDTEVFNIMLSGYVRKRDVSLFHKTLFKMDARYFAPNARSWLLFLELVQSDDERRQVIAAMYELGQFEEDPATRRGIARIMASSDAYSAFKAGKKLDAFLDEQNTRYGEGWLTPRSLTSIIVEFLRFHRNDNPRFDDFKRLIEQQARHNQKLDTRTVNLVLKHCVEERDWKTAIWVLGPLRFYGIELTYETYSLLISLAMRTRAPAALGMIFFYAVLQRKLRRNGRWTMHAVLLNSIPSNFWAHVKPKIMSKRMLRTLAERKVSTPRNTVAAVERAILEVCDGYQPARDLSEVLDVAYRTMDRPLRRQVAQVLKTKTKAASRRRERPHQRKQQEQQSIRVADFALPLVDVSGRGRGKKTVHLDASFEPEDLVEGFDPDYLKRKLASEDPLEWEVSEVVASV